MNGAELDAKPARAARRERLASAPVATEGEHREGRAVCALP